MFDEIDIKSLQAEWDALSFEEQCRISDDYAMAVLESGRDVGDHRYHRILSAK